jgi:hypothetical protein
LGQARNRRNSAGLNTKKWNKYGIAWPQINIWRNKDEIPGLNFSNQVAQATLPLNRLAAKPIAPLNHLLIKKWVLHFLVKSCSAHPAAFFCHDGECHKAPF